jgi:hypothetical protein
MDKNSTQGEKNRMSPTLGQAFMSLENLSNDSHEKRYKKLYELSKRYVTQRGFADASLDLAVRTLPVME